MGGREKEGPRGVEGEVPARAGVGFPAPTATLSVELQHC